ncbi:putative transcriptional regulator, LacI family protein [Oceanicola granulosus HTCC2516]|uniref:Putative transcriptional regulator, LacI family protein n=1 Tax=Oceanicola granulosus (strain ATCC BAA-861 / DSM 15982 / KCTC 12143 / HTCC2516) TaxID=314256 RepID=Q2CHJ1_OCEGH|nr:LacI family DNA-binding transcriptional regulator [Oceanicola granulosus]EAR52048.1 putative transcriptional regulator, LacI family protein [Oceanicola granulosus HTCC2516]
MATIRDVARAAGVSTSTVSLTFGEPSRVSDETAQRVWEAASTLGYRPNPLAQSLKRGHSRLIGVTVGDITNPFFGRLFKHVERNAHEAGYHVIVTDTDAQADREEQVLAQLDAQRIAGIILTAHGSGPHYTSHLERLKAPVVTVDHRVPGTKLDYVASDTRLAASIITEHLVRLGHRRIAHIAGTPHLFTAGERIAGFVETMRRNGLDVDHSLIVDGHFDYENAYAQTMRLLTRPDRPTALFAANNMMALGALQAIFELGFDCPRDISLACIDDVPWSSVIRPKITMVEQDIPELARIATDYLVSRMSVSGRDAPPRETILTPRLVMGTSTAPPPA